MIEKVPPNRREANMEKRPDFNDLKSFEEFSKCYWYREELSAICKQLGIDHTGTKQDLNYNIKEYFNGNRITKRCTSRRPKVTKEVTLDAPLLDCGFSFNADFRAFFAKQTGVENFKFTADMAAAWRKVKQNNDSAFTIQDMLDIYNHKSDYAKYDNSSCEWNQFLKDFCADGKNEKYHDKLKVAAILWNKVRNSTQQKIYSHELVEKYYDMLPEE